MSDGVIINISKGTGYNKQVLKSNYQVWISYKFDAIKPLETKNWLPFTVYRGESLNSHVFVEFPNKILHKNWFE